jgi:hypothetical protein
MTRGERNQAKKRANNGLFRVCRVFHETAGSVVNGIIAALAPAGLKLEKELFGPELCIYPTQFHTEVIPVLESESGVQVSYLALHLYRFESGRYEAVTYFTC